MVGKKYAFLIVGSGAGGATLAKELSKRGKEVLVLEKGRLEKKLGTFQAAVNFFDTNKITKIPRKSKEGVTFWRTIMAGGSTIVSCANGARTLQKELLEFGIDLDNEFAEIDNEIKVNLVSESLLSEGSNSIRSAAKDLGYEMKPMPKFLDQTKCKKCGNCVLGCKHGAKWTALDYLNEAQQNNAEIIYETEVHEVIIENGKIKGVRASGPNGQLEIIADVVILAAGGLTTPVILMNSGIKNAGGALFIDFQIHTYGITKNLNLLHEPQMALINDQFHKSKGFILSPFVNNPRQVRFLEAGVNGFTLSTNRLLGIMTKITDEQAGCVYPDGTVSKPVMKNDWAKIKEGTGIAREILLKAGADKKSILDTRPAGSHQGGTAAIGKVVDIHLQTEIENLFVCDASVFPVTPGLPPILTIVALAKRLAKTLVLMR